MQLLAYILALQTLGSVPPHVSASTYLAAQRHDVDPVILGAYLVSEHDDDWTPTPEQCGDDGRTCGPFSLSALWAREFGYRARDRGHVWHAANMAAQLMLYSHERHHGRCQGAHDWRAHVKSGPGGRHLAAGSVREWKRWESRIRAEMVREGGGES
jgi:hypothetical protein